MTTITGEILEPLRTNLYFLFLNHLQLFSNQKFTKTRL